MKAVVISYNWETGEHLSTPLEGEAAFKASAWVHPNSFLWRDFPAAEGWTHFYHEDKECQEARADKWVDEISRGDFIEEWIP